MMALKTSFASPYHQEHTTEIETGVEKHFVWAFMKCGIKPGYQNAIVHAENVTFLP